MTILNFEILTSKSFGGIACHLVLDFLVSLPSVLGFICLRFRWVMFGVSLHLLHIEGFPPVSVSHLMRLLA